MGKRKQPVTEIKERVIAMLKSRAWDHPFAGALKLRWDGVRSESYWVNPKTGEELDLIAAAQDKSVGPDAWLVLTDHIARLIESGDALPVRYRDFAARLVRGEALPPNHRSHKDGKAGPFKLERRDFAICVCMAALNSAGYALENGARGQQSASEIVANEMDGIEASAAYSIWRTNKKRFSETLLWEIALDRLCTGSDEHGRLMEWADKVDVKRKRRALSEASALRDGHEQNTVK